MKRDVNDRGTLLDLQGEKLLVLKPGRPDRVFTFVHVVHPDRHELHAVCRIPEHKADWTITQAYLDAVHEARPNEHGCKWELKVK